MSDSVSPALAGRLKIALRAAEQAGVILMGHLGTLKEYEHKGTVDLVTLADRQSEACILGELRGAFGGDTVLAEERDGPEGADRLRHVVADAPWCWVVDPLDGTTNFAHSHLNFCISIGLLAYGVPVLGVVLAPARREIYVGGQGIAATCNGKPIAISSVAHLERALLATGFPYDRRERLPQILQWLGRALQTCHCVRRGGSAALDLCELAAGRLDGFYEPGLRPWDLCAGQAIVQAAGGQLSDFEGRAHDLFGGYTVASNRKIHDQLILRITGPAASAPVVG